MNPGLWVNLDCGVLSADHLKLTRHRAFTSPSGTCISPMKEFPVGSSIKGKLLLGFAFSGELSFLYKRGGILDVVLIFADCSSSTDLEGILLRLPLFLSLRSSSPVFYFPVHLSAFTRSDCGFWQS
jgi:hypothetical protein